MVRHQAALAAGSEPALTSGGNLPPLEVIMSRLTYVREKAKLDV